MTTTWNDRTFAKRPSIVPPSKHFYPPFRCPDCGKVWQGVQKCFTCHEVPEDA